MSILTILTTLLVVFAVPANAKSSHKPTCSKEDIIKAVQKDFSAEDATNIDFDRHEVKFNAPDFPDKKNYRLMRCKFRCEDDSAYPVTLYNCGGLSSHSQ